MGRRARAESPLDLELEELPPELRWREWMSRVEAVIFASPEPMTREALARVVGKSCNLDLLIDDIKEELRGRPYELVAVAGGWRHQTRKNFAEAIRAATGLAAAVKELSRAEAGVLMAIAYFQPVTRGEISEMFGRESQPRPDRLVARRRADRRRAAQSTTGRALRLCDDAGVFVGIRVREPARFA